MGLHLKEKTTSPTSFRLIDWLSARKTTRNNKITYSWIFEDSKRYSIHKTIKLDYSSELKGNARVVSDPHRGKALKLDGKGDYATPPPHIFP